MPLIIIDSKGQQIYRLLSIFKKQVHRQAFKKKSVFTPPNYNEAYYKAMEHLATNPDY
jgi:hypothetical protein